VAERSELVRGHEPTGHPGPVATGLEVSAPGLARGRWWARVQWGKIGLFITSLYLFVLAIALMKEGARSIAPLVRMSIAVENIANSLGFGWLFAYVIMSGSPVAWERGSSSSPLACSTSCGAVTG
jgi:hypothetical protein